MKIILSNTLDIIENIKIKNNKNHIIEIYYYYYFFRL